MLFLQKFSKFRIHFCKKGHWNLSMNRWKWSKFCCGSFGEKKKQNGTLFNATRAIIKGSYVTFLIWVRFSKFRIFPKKKNNHRAIDFSFLHTHAPHWGWWIPLDFFSFREWNIMNFQKFNFNFFTPFQLIAQNHRGTNMFLLQSTFSSCIFFPKRKIKLITFWTIFFLVCLHFLPKLKKTLTLSMEISFQS